MAVIGHDVWIGSDAMILEGVRAGTGAVIAVRAVVVKDVLLYSIVVGFPAKVVRFRFEPALIELLLAIRWWDVEVNALGGASVESSICRSQVAGAYSTREVRRFKIRHQSLRCLRTDCQGWVGAFVYSFFWGNGDCPHFPIPSPCTS